MDRKKELEKYIEEYRIDRISIKKENRAWVIKELTPVFCKKLKFLIKNQLLQNRDIIGNVENFYLCRLISSGYTESYESVLGLSNALLFLDKRRSQTYWCPEYIYRDLECDMKEVEKRLRKKFVRIEEYELLHLKQLLLKDDWEVLKDCFHELAQEQLSMITDSTLDLKPELNVMYGDYMDQLQLISSLRIERLIDEENTQV